MSAWRVLGIESSCDEMAAAVLRGDSEILANVIHEQADVHQPYGGVVPELASRDHVRAVSQVTQRALAEAGVRLEDIEGVAVTAGPGLVGSLLAEADDEWQVHRRYFSKDSMRQLYETDLDMLAEPTPLTLAPVR